MDLMNVTELTTYVKFAWKILNLISDNTNLKRGKKLLSVLKSGLVQN